MYIFLKYIHSFAQFFILFGILWKSFSQPFNDQITKSGDDEDYNDAFIQEKTKYSMLTKRGKYSAALKYFALQHLFT